MTSEQDKRRQRWQAWYAQNKYDPERKVRNRARARAWYYANPEKAKQYARARRTRRAAAPEAERMYKREWYRRSRLQARGLPPPSRPEPQVCELCNKQKPTGKVLAYDHCHTTGRFRGWICTSCNRGLGLLGDTLESLTRAVEYLRRANTEKR